MEIAKVYNHIANDFSDTRYRAWTTVADFLETIDEHSINADIGCGNGKNMLHRKELKFMGLDISTEFVKICHSRGLNVINGSVIDIPFNDNTFDNTICIAVIHHLQNKMDRIRAISELLRITRYGGKILIYNWAFEQPRDAKRKFSTCDEMVSFKKKNGEVYYRYYHLYTKGELVDEIKMTNYDVLIEEHYEQGNWYCIVIKKIGIAS